MLKPHAKVVGRVVSPCNPLGKVLRSPRVNLITLSYILWLFCGSLGFFLMPGMCHQGIGPIHQDLTIMSRSIQRLLLVLPHIALMPELYFKCHNPIQGLLQQLLRIICLCLGYSLILGSLSGGIIQISNLIHAVLVYTQPGGEEGYRYTEQCRKMLFRIKK